MFQTGTKVRRSKAYYEWMHANPSQIPFGLNREFTVKSDDGSKISFEETIVIDDSKYWEFCTLPQPTFKKNQKVYITNPNWVYTAEADSYFFNNTEYVLLINQHGISISVQPVKTCTLVSFTPKFRKGDLLNSIKHPPHIIYRATTDSYLDEKLAELVDVQSTSSGDESIYRNVDVRILYKAATEIFVPKFKKGDQLFPHNTTEPDRYRVAIYDSYVHHNGREYVQYDVYSEDGTLFLNGICTDVICFRIDTRKFVNNKLWSPKFKTGDCIRPKPQYSYRDAVRVVSEDSSVHIVRFTRYCKGIFDDNDSGNPESYDIDDRIIIDNKPFEPKIKKGDRIIGELSPTGIFTAQNDSHWDKTTKTEKLTHKGYQFDETVDISKLLIVETRKP